MKFLQRYDSFSHIQEINKKYEQFLTYTLRTFILSKNARCANSMTQRALKLSRHLRVRLFTSNEADRFLYKRTPGHCGRL